VIFRFKLRDWCVLNQNGASLSKAELMAIWQVDRFGGNEIIVKPAPFQLVAGLKFDRKSYPRSWLTRHPKKLIPL